MSGGWMSRRRKGAIMRRKFKTQLCSIVTGVLFAAAPWLLLGGCERSLTFALDDVAGVAQTTLFH